MNIASGRPYGRVLPTLLIWLILLQKVAEQHSQASDRLSDEDALWQTDGAKLVSERRHTAGLANWGSSVQSRFANRLK
ncbi:hypothetical protein [Noviherbaspirillum sp.]|uniref:hypothetical protein n=1 Tax=Noviherbaspirillum sp. TaxID=1926288 RepID=UPI002FDFAF1B